MMATVEPAELGPYSHLGRVRHPGKDRSLVVGDNFYMEFAVARSVELAEENALPATQQQFSVGDEDGLGVAYQNGFDVRVGIAFAVFIRAAIGDQAIKSSLDVAGHVGIRV